MGDVVCSSVVGVRGVQGEAADARGVAERSCGGALARVPFRVPTAGSRLRPFRPRKGFDPAPGGPGLAGGWS